MATTQLISLFDTRVNDWLNDKGPNEFDIDSSHVELVYDDGIYSVLINGEEVAWNDNPKDFRLVSKFIFACEAEVIKANTTA